MKGIGAMMILKHHQSRDMFYIKCLKIYIKSATRDSRFLLAGLGRDKLGLHFILCV